VKSALLRGGEHTAIGAIAERAGDRVAIALSRGGAEKGYAHTDPNEDSALCAEGPRGLLVAVADGHSGHRGAEAALEHLVAGPARSWTDGSARSEHAWYQDVLMALAETNDAVLASRVGGRRPRTTLALALVRPEEDLLITASLGDSHLFRVVNDAVREPGGGRARSSLFLGEEPRTPSALERGGHLAVEPLGPTRALLAVTDGLSETRIGVDDPAEAVLEAASRAASEAALQRPRALARAVVEAALAAHRANASGDNVAAAAAWLDDDTRA
jgi:hypothetical protein